MRPNAGSRVALAAAAMLAGCGAPGNAGRAPATAGTEAALSAHPAVRDLDRAALQALYATPHREDGTVLAGAHAGAHWTKWTKPDGSAELSAAHGLFADSGKYVIRADRVCWRWSQIDSGRETCMRVMKVGDNEYKTFAPDGSEGSRFRVGPPDR